MLLLLLLSFSVADFVFVCGEVSSKLLSLSPPSLLPSVARIISLSSTPSVFLPQINDDDADDGGDKDEPSSSDLPTRRDRMMPPPPSSDPSSSLQHR